MGKNIEEYFRLNANQGTDPMIVWEAHKCVVRGILMAKEARAKKQHQATLNALLTQIHNLE